MAISFQTDRLYLLPIQDAHYDSFKSTIQDAFIRKYLCDDQVFSDEIITDFFNSSQHTFEHDGYGLWIIQIRKEQEFIGFAGLKTFFEETQPQLLYALYETYTGKGYAFEAAKRIIKYCFEALDYTYLIAACDAPNLPSQKLALKLGMHQFKEEIHNGIKTYFFKLKK